MAIDPNAYEPWYNRKNYTVHHTNGEGFISYQDAEKLTRNLPAVNVYMHDSGMAAVHNYPCPMCKIEHAVFVTSSGYFDVCYKCREEGWQVVHKKDVADGSFWTKLKELFS